MCVCYADKSKQSFTIANSVVYPTAKVEHWPSAPHPSVILSRGLIYKISYDLSRYYLKSIVRSTYNSNVQGKKVKFFNIRYRALGPELIPVYRQSARR